MTASRGRTLTDEGATFWLSKDGWDSEESNWLLHGLDPRHQVSIATIGGRRTILPPMAPDDDLAALIARAYESGALKPYAEPSAVFAWAISKGIRTPAQFATRAMSQQERRKALDAAGLTHVSAAPEPLEAVRSTGYTKPRNSPPPIDWDHWRYMPEVTLGEAVALSLGENPDLFDVDDPSEAFEKRLKIAVSNARTGRLQLVMHYANERVSPVLLSIFVAWAKGLNLPNLPPEFLALVEQGDRNTARQPSAANPDSVPQPAKRKTWRDVALPYVRDMYRDGQFATAKALYQAMFRLAGTPESPFDKGTGPHAHSLFVRDIAEPLEVKTLQNAWGEIKANS